MPLTAKDIAAMTDLAAVKAECDENDVRQMVQVAKQFGCKCVIALPGMTELVCELVAGTDIILAGVVGFPSGGNTSAAKAFEAAELVRLGCRELDMVINVGMLRSGRLGYVRDDIASVVQASQGLDVKVILECHYLSDDQIRSACDACRQGGAKWVKTSTGWAGSGATVHNISLIKSCVGESMQIKASGGIRTVGQIQELYNCGARRFGIGSASAVEIFRQIKDKS